LDLLKPAWTNALAQIHAAAKGASTGHRDPEAGNHAACPEVKWNQVWEEQ
jgi:hypothetical protein